MTKANERQVGGITTKANERQVGGDHYKTGGGGLECWDLFGPEFLVGCAVKHVSRWRKKNGVQDLEKALHYAQKLKEIAPQYAAAGGDRYLVNHAIANDLVHAWMRNAGLDWAEQMICLNLIYCKRVIDVGSAINGIEYLIERERGKTTPTLQAIVDLQKSGKTTGTGQVKSKPYTEMTDDELATELQTLEIKQSQATGWGAAVGVRGEYIDEIKREQKRRQGAGKSNGANDMRPGDRVRYAIDGRTGVAKEFLQDGDATVRFDDGKVQEVKWNHLRKLEPLRAEDIFGDVEVVARWNEKSGKWESTRRDEDTFGGLRPSARKTVGGEMCESCGKSLLNGRLRWSDGTGKVYCFECMPKEAK